MGFTAVADLQLQAEAALSRSLWQRFRDSLLPEERCPVPALCLPPAARLVLRDVAPSLREKYALRSEEEVKFVQLSADPNTYRDALCFRNGTVLRLQHLPAGQRATVVSLGGDDSHELRDFEIRGALPNLM